MEQIEKAGDAQLAREIEVALPVELSRAEQTARDLTPEAKKTIRDAGDKITKGAALKISRLPPDQQEEAAAVLTIAPPTPKQQGMKDGEV